MIAKSRQLSVNPFRLSAIEVEDLRRILAKRANQRILRLEHTKVSANERGIDFKAGQYAYQQIGKIRGQGYKRFRESSLAIGDQTARQELYVLQSFLSEKSSRYGKIKKEVSKTQKTFEGRGIKVGSFKTFYNFLDSQAFRELKGSFSSETIIDFYERAYEEGSSNKKIQSVIDEYLKDTEVSGDGMNLKDFANKLGIKVFR